MPEQGDIVLVPVPFTDLTAQKKRPVIVISNDAYNHRTDDVIVVAMTSHPQAGVYSLPITSSDLEQGALNRPGRVRADKIYTLAQRIVLKTFGRVKATVLDQIRGMLQDIVSAKD
jgi:mRNA-degrading endonuclease toxin of MazEF toxin-antitoxin module